MTLPSTEMIDCRVVGGDKLPGDIGGSDALCAAIKRAAAAGAPTKRFRVEVRVLGRSSLAATLTTAKGSKLPEQRFAVSDRNLTRGSLDRFAKALVDQVARAP